MKKLWTDNVKAGLLLVLILMLGFITILPWWFFVIPAILLGIWSRSVRWKPAYFLVGFLAGFLVWFGLNFCYDLTMNGIILHRIGLLLSVQKLVVLLIAGAIGGLLTGLAFYTGGLLLAKK